MAASKDLSDLYEHTGIDWDLRIEIPLTEPCCLTGWLIPDPNEDDWIPVHLGWVDSVDQIDEFFYRARGWIEKTFGATAYG